MELLDELLECRNCGIKMGVLSFFMDPGSTHDSAYKPFKHPKVAICIECLPEELEKRKEEGLDIEKVESWLERI